MAIDYLNVLFVKADSRERKLDRLLFLAQIEVQHPAADRVVAV